MVKFINLVLSTHAVKPELKTLYVNLAAIQSIMVSDEHSCSVHIRDHASAVLIEESLFSIMTRIREINGA